MGAGQLTNVVSEFHRNRKKLPPMTHFVIASFIAPWRLLASQIRFEKLQVNNGTV
jgi:hypothetical protein